MAGAQRHMFPGNNTPRGFYSYYQYILSQEEAEQIYCIKGGPGTGKSTFMKRIGHEMLKEGHDIDFLHCSSDNNSLDGIVIRDKNIAFIDATSPHIVDPISPGAVDTILHLGDFWNREGIKVHKRKIIDNQARLSALFKNAYNYFAAAKSIYDNIAMVYEKAIAKEAMYKIAADLTAEELAHKEINNKRGNVKKSFASGITPGGFKNYLDVLTESYDKVYVFDAPVGVSAQSILGVFCDSALYRGFDAEMYYCPLDPENKLEHILIPELSIAMITSNDYHPFSREGAYVIDLLSYVDRAVTDENESMIHDGEKMMGELMQKGIQCLKSAKKEHDELEGYYIPNMDFEAVEELRQKVVSDIRRR